MESNKERVSKLVTGNIKHFPMEPFIVTHRELCETILNDFNKFDL